MERLSEENPDQEGNLKKSDTDPKKPFLISDPEAKKAVESFLKKVHDKPFLNRTSSLLLQTLATIALFVTPQGREILKDPYLRRIIFDNERRIGRLRDTIIEHSLIHPTEDRSRLENSVADPGRWVSYDFRRTSEFREDLPFNGSIRRMGRLAVFPLPEVINSDPEETTPKNLIQPFSLYHGMFLELPSMERLIELGMARETSYGKAYESAGVSTRYSNQLYLDQHQDKPVYQVTPKGNGLVFILREAGTTKKKPQTDKPPKLSLAYN